ATGPRYALRLTRSADQLRPTQPAERRTRGRSRRRRFGVLQTPTDCFRVRAKAVGCRRVVAARGRTTTAAPMAWKRTARTLGLLTCESRRTERPGGATRPAPCERAGCRRSLLLRRRRRA